MEAELLKLRMEKKEATAKADKLQRELKTIMEQRIIAGLYSSPLLQVEILSLDKIKLYHTMKISLAQLDI